MKCTCNIRQRRLSPGVFNLKQCVNDTQQMVWTLTTHTTDSGADLCDFDPYLLLCVGGRMDEVRLTTNEIAATAPEEESTLELIWNVGNYATELKGYVKYQIVFRGNVIGQLGVIGSTDANANGVYDLDNQAASGFSRTWTNNAEGSGYKLKYDTTNEVWAIYEADGTTQVDAQGWPEVEPFCGLWGTVAVSNGCACSWYSDEAIMFISDTITADQNITAKFPTVLRQVWEAVNRLILQSGANVLEVEFTADDWTTDSDVQSMTINSIIPAAYSGATIASIRIFDANGVSVDNFEINNGDIKALSTFAGKAVFVFQGGNGYTIADGEEG